MHREPRQQPIPSVVWRVRRGNITLQVFSKIASGNRIAPGVNALLPPGEPTEEGIPIEDIEVPMQ
eukprot:4279078-Prorocentrum_lima.AAC.1